MNFWRKACMPFRDLFLHLRLKELIVVIKKQESRHVHSHLSFARVRAGA